MYKTEAHLVARAIRNAIRANRFARIIRNWNPYFYSASGRFAQMTRISDSRESPDSRESCESIRANHATKEAQKHRESKKTKPPKPKKNQKNTFVHSGKPPLFLFFLLLSHVCKAVFCSKHYKNSVFSRAQLVGITDSKTPFGAPSQNGTFATESAILCFPRCLLKPLFL